MRENSCILVTLVKQNPSAAELNYGYQESEREHSSTSANTSFISLLSYWTHESGEQIDRTGSLSETFDWSERGKFNYPTGIVQRNLVYLSKLRVTRASGKQKERSPSLYLRLLLLTFRIQL